MKHEIQYIPLSFSSETSDASALRLIAYLRPDWLAAGSDVAFVRFTDGITNTLLKAINQRAGLRKEQIDADAILLRAYGNGTDVLIDRHREAQNHELLARHGLAPELLARFENGMMYRFISGSVTQPEDLRRPAIYRAVARRLAQWHATMPCVPGHTGHSRKCSRADGLAPQSDEDFQTALDSVAPGKPSPNVWSVMQKWIFALPNDTEAQRSRQTDLQKELGRLIADFSQRDGLGENGLVFAHCDLLSGNVIVLPNTDSAANGKSHSAVNGNVNGHGGFKGASSGATSETVSVTFIDYEYATPSPAAFDIANHFAEWGGFDCDFSVLPNRSQRRDFIEVYARAYFDYLPLSPEPAEVAREADRLFDEVDLFRGVPGFYWGIWALIQATISKIDFDYANYAETRLGEYHAWRAETDGSRKASGEQMPLRERRWAQED